MEPLDHDLLHLLLVVGEVTVQEELLAGLHSGRGRDVADGHRGHNWGRQGDGKW